MNRVLVNAVWLQRSIITRFSFEAQESSIFAAAVTDLRLLCYNDSGNREENKGGAGGGGCMCMAAIYHANSGRASVQVGVRVRV